MTRSEKILAWILGVSVVLASGTMIAFAVVNRKKKRIGCKSSARLLFIGDSQTVFHPGYAEKLVAKCPGLTMKKIAKVGENTSWMLTQLQNELQHNKYDAIFVLGGSNDIYGGMQTSKTKSNLTTIYDMIKKSGAMSIAITPPNKNFYEGRTDERQQKLADVVNWIMSNPVPDIKINLWKLTNNPAYFGSDNMHMNSAGHEALANEVLKNL